MCMCVWALVWGDEDSLGIGQLDHHSEHCLMLLLTHTNIHVVAEHTFRAHTDCSRSLVCEFGCHRGRVQLVWQQDIDS